MKKRRISYVIAVCLMAAAIITARAFTPCSDYIDINKNTPTQCPGCNGHRYDKNWQYCLGTGTSWVEDCYDGTIANRLATDKYTCVLGSCTAATPGDGTTYTFPNTPWVTLHPDLSCFGS